MSAWTSYLTFAGAVVLLFLPRIVARWISLATTAAGFVTSLIAFFPIIDVGTFKTILRIPWVPMLRMEYHLAVDGFTLTIPLFTHLFAVASVLSSWESHHR